jgi:ribose 5-phosphate isomerase B
MLISIASDHAGIKMRAEIMEYLHFNRHTAIDFGSFKSGIPVDYPDFAQVVCHSVQEQKTERGILICGIGVGMCIAANRFTGIRAAVGTERVIEQARLHNDINVICFGARVQGMDEVVRCLEVFLLLDASAHKRHQKRIDKLDLIGGI